MKVICAVYIFTLLSTHQSPFDKSLYYSENQGKWVYVEIGRKFFSSISFGSFFEKYKKYFFSSV